jgi:dTDP-4-amino-4,6-dideoxygalactose transaminase
MKLKNRKTARVRRVFIPQTPTLRLSALFWGAFRAGPLPAPLAERALLVHYGRNALFYALKTLNVTPDQHVLVPAFCCTAVLEPFKALGLKVRLYPVDQRLAPETSELEALTDENTAAVLLVHYFGFPMGLPQTLEFCRRRRLALIEDCAHALFGETDGQTLGSFGDVATFSMRKTLPIPGGGALVLNNPRYQLPPGAPWARASLGRVANTTLGLTLKDLFLRYGPWAGVLAKQLWRQTVLDGTPLAGNPMVPGRPPQWFHPGISPLAARLLTRSSRERVVQARRRNYQFWIDHVGEVDGVRPLLGALREGICPYSFPVLAQHRDELLARLVGHGVFLEPTFNESPPMDPEVVLNAETDFPWARELARHIVSLPVYQGLETRHLLGVLELLREHAGRG